MEEQTERMYHLMKKESNRLKTFQMNPPWPKDYVDIKKLAKAGFFYAFKGDNVHCAFCRGQVCRWDREDDPMSEHARHFTTCPFIMGGDVGNEPFGEDPFPGPKRPRPYDVCGIHSSSDEESQVHHEHSLQSLSSSEDDNNGPPQEIVQSTNDRSIVNNNTLIQNLPQRDDLATQNVTNEPTHHNHSQNLKNSHHTPAYGELPTNPETDKVSQANSNCNSNNLSGICKICYTNPIELVFLPCGHSISCLSCSQSLYSCPYCRATISTRIRTFLV